MNYDFHLRVSSGFAGFLPSQSATDWLWIAVKQWSVASDQWSRDQRSGIRDQRMTRRTPENHLLFRLGYFQYDEKREITGKVGREFFGGGERVSGSASQRAGRLMAAGKGRDGAGGRFGRWRCAASAMKPLPLLVEWVRFMEKRLFLIENGCDLGRFAVPGGAGGGDVCQR
jgi:hypothetical protein